MLCSLLVGQKEVGKNSCEVDFSAQEDRRSPRAHIQTTSPFTSKQEGGSGFLDSPGFGSVYCPYWNLPSPPTLCCPRVLRRGVIGLGSPLIFSVHRYVYNIYIYINTHLLLIIWVHHRSSFSSSSQGNTFLSGPEDNSDQVQLLSNMKHLEQYTKGLLKAPVIHFTINILQWTLQWSFHLAKIKQALKLRLCVFYAAGQVHVTRSLKQPLRS